MKRVSWKEFKDNGMLWFVNTILHLFGYAIVYEIDNEEIIDVYVARVSFRGFNEKSNSDGYIKVSKYLFENINDLLKEAES